MWRFSVCLMVVGMAYFSVEAQLATPDICGEPKGDNEPISVMMFSDFACEHCDSVRPVIDRLRAIYPGSVEVLFKHAPRSNDASLWLLHEAALAAEAQGKFWEMHDLIFKTSGHDGREDLEGFAQHLHLDMKVFKKDLDTHRFRGHIERDLSEARALWVTGTPAFFVNGVDMIGVGAFAEFVETLASPTLSTDEKAIVSLGASPQIGFAESPVTIVSFIDLRCGFCAETWPMLAKVVAEQNGLVRWGFKHFPLSFHTDAMLAHRAALSAGEQGRFWDMATQILNHADVLQHADILQFAHNLNLDISKFEADLENAALLDTIVHDMEEGRRLGVQGTPTFFVNGIKVVGAQSEHELQVVIADVLRKLKVSPQQKEPNSWLDVETKGSIPSAGDMEDPAGKR